MNISDVVRHHFHVIVTGAFACVLFLLLGLADLQYFTPKTTSYGAELIGASYLYDEQTGQVIAGGSVSVAGPGTVTILNDGSATGTYSFITDGTAGTYTLTIAPPPGYSLSGTCAAQAGAYNAAPGAQVDFGSRLGIDGALATSTCAGNQYYTQFDLTNGDQVIALNNIPLTAPSTCTGSDIAGIVFRDYNANGNRENTATTTEPFIGDITVAAYNNAGTLVDSCRTTSSTGAYGLTVAAGTHVRLEFIGVPGYLEPSISGAGGASSSTVVFVTSTAANVNLALANPAEYCQAFPEYALVQPGVFGDASAAGAFSTTPTVYYIPFGANTNPGTVNFTPGPTFGDIGSTFGVAYHRQSNSIFTSAFLKRHSDFGPGGIGAIYQINRTTGATSTFFDFDAVLGAGTAGTDPHPAATDTCNTPIGGFGSPSLEGCWIHETTSTFDMIGEASLGDMDLSEDGETMWVINLFDRNLYELPIGSAPTAPAAGQVSSYPIPNDCGGTTEDYRPFALDVQDGLVYVGVTCTSESTQVSTTLHARVYSFDGANFTQVLNVPLSGNDNRRLCSAYSNLAVDFTCLDAPTDTWEASWNPWLTAGSYLFANDNNFRYMTEPQPWLVDIDFYNGDMLLGFRDRYGDQTALGGGSTDPNDGADRYASVGAWGEILRACQNTAGSWDLEQNGVCGGVTGAGNARGIGPGANPAGPFGRFYSPVDFFNSFGTADRADYKSLGTMAQLPGYFELLTPSSDPSPTASEGDWHSAGVLWYNNLTGASSTYYRMFTPRGANNPENYDYGLNTGSAQDHFYPGKNGTLADAEFLCNSAPIEIGNRVWVDTDNDGIQDAGEYGLAGVTTTLFADTTANGTPDTQVGTAITDSLGRYYYGGLAVTNMTTSVVPGTAYEVRIDMTQTAVATPGYSLTTAGASRDTIDSDGVTSGSNAVASFTTGLAGVTTHNEDFGLTSAQIDLTVTTTPTSTVVSAGSSLQLVYTYTNSSTVTSTNVIVSTTVQASTTFNLAGSTGTWSCADNAVAGTTCTSSIGTLAPLATGTITFGLTADSISATTTVTNTVRIYDDAASGADIDLTTNTSSAYITITPLTTDLDLIVTNTSSPSSGQGGTIFQFTYVYTNSSTVTSTGVIVSTTVPTNLTFHTASSTGTWSCADGAVAATTCTSSIGTLAPGATSSIIFAGTGVVQTVTTTVTNTVDISDDGVQGSDNDTTNNLATSTITITPTLLIDLIVSSTISS